MASVPSMQKMYNDFRPVTDKSNFVRSLLLSLVRYKYARYIDIKGTMILFSILEFHKRKNYYFHMLLGGLYIPNSV